MGSSAKPSYLSGLSVMQFDGGFYIRLNSLSNLELERVDSDQGSGIDSDVHSNRSIIALAHYSCAAGWTELRQSMNIAFIISAEYEKSYPVSHCLVGKLVGDQNIVSFLNLKFAWAWEHPEVSFLEI